MKIKSLIALRTQTFTIPYRCLNGHVSSLLELATANSVLLLSLGLFILCQTAAASALGLERITRADLKPLVQGMPGEQAFRKRIVVATNVTMSAELEVTAKGNGYLRIGNLNLKVFDSHDDGTYFEKDLLTIDFADIDGDGKRELSYAASCAIRMTEQKRWSGEKR